MDKRQIEKAVVFLIRKTDLKPEEALDFVDFMPEWEPGTHYPINAFVRHGVDEKGNPQLWRVIAYDNRGREPGHEDNYRAPMFVPVVRDYHENDESGKDDE